MTIKIPLYNRYNLYKIFKEKGGNNMKRLSCALMLLAFLAACNDGGTPTCVGPNGSCDFSGLTPDPNRFIDPASNSNKRINMMISLNDAQVSSYVKHKLNGYTGAVASDYLAIAQTALAIAKDEPVSGVSEDILNPAMYVVSPQLFASCASGNDGAACISNWTLNNEEILTQRLIELRARADNLDITSATFETSADTVLTFSIDDSGKIVGVKVGDDEYSRSGNTSVFTDGENSIIYKSGVLMENTSVPSLSYSDFGEYQIVKNGVAGNNIPYAGGYASRKIAENAILSGIESNVNFFGTAVGTVTNEDNEVLDIVDNRASLVFSKDTGVSTLNANFSNWYNISVAKNIDTTNADITFYGYKGTADYKLKDNVVSGSADMNVGYYGPSPDTGIPTEATGLVDFTGGGINMDLAFGVK